MCPTFAPCAALNTRRIPSPLLTESLGNKGFG